MTQPGTEQAPATLASRWREDRRGTSMVTTAMTLPILFLLVMLIFYLIMLLVIKWQLDRGTQEAARHIGEQARYWEISGTQQSNPFSPTEQISGTMAIPADFYEIEARRVIASRLRDLRFYSHNYITANLVVSVTEPALTGAPDAPPVVEGEEYGPTDGTLVQVCRELRKERGGQPNVGEYLYHKNVRFIIRSSFNVPWWVTIPFTNSWRLITLQDRAMGYAQCPRWWGKLDRQDFDKARWLGVEGPDIPWRFGLATPGWPTVTLPPDPTKEPTTTPTVIP
ncbi:MAG: hypothetical protein U0470_05180 [Anaerolineae bacterium]